MPTQAPELTVTVEKPAAWSRRLTITVPADRIVQEKKEAVSRLAKQARLPGFRKGRVPAGVMERKFGPAIEQEALEKVVSDAYREALETEGLQPISQGSVENFEYQPGSDLTFNVELEVRPEIELERVGGFTIVREEAAVGDEQVDEVLQRLREENAVWTAKEGDPPVAGDRATVEITPLDAESGAEPSKPRSYQIVIGEGEAIPAVEDAVRTLRAGEEADFEVELAADPEDPASEKKLHRMHIRMVELNAPQYPEIDDEFARGLGDFEDLATLRARIREDLEKEATREAERGVRLQLVQQIVEANPFDVPDSMIRGYLERALPAPEGADAQRVEAMREQMRPAAEQALKRSLVVERIAEMEGLRATPAELDARIDEIAERMGRSRGELMGQLRQGGRIEELEQEITEEKVFGYLASLSDIQ